MTTLWLKLRAALMPGATVIVVDAGGAHCVRGAVSGIVLHELTEILGECGVDQGIIAVGRGESGPKLRFAGAFDESARQRVRNLWLARPERRMTGV